MNAILQGLLKAINGLQRPEPLKPPANITGRRG